MKIDIPTVKGLLKTLANYEATEDDDLLIGFVIQERINYILNYCNCDTLPERLIPTVLKMIVGEFLYQKYSTGGSEALGIETLALISGVTEDDFTFDFDNTGDSSGDVYVLNFIENLRRGDSYMLQRFRSVTHRS